MCSAWKIVHTGITVKTNYNGKDILFIHELLIITMGSNIISCVSYMSHNKKNTKSST